MSDSLEQAVSVETPGKYIEDENNKNMPADKEYNENYIEKNIEYIEKNWSNSGNWSNWNYGWNDYGWNSRYGGNQFDDDDDKRYDYSWNNSYGDNHRYEDADNHRYADPRYEDTYNQHYVHNNYEENWNKSP